MTGIEHSAHFWKGRRVLITGHTGFKGSWLSMWLAARHAHVFGYALDPHTSPSLFEKANVAECMTRSYIADIRDCSALLRAIEDTRPEVVFHLAAQPLVLNSYANPVETYEVNVMGTVNTLEACRRVDSVKAIVVVTTDKVYENQEWTWGYRENDRLGGNDPYSNSKACCELVVQAYWRSFFRNSCDGNQRIGLATARAGNVIGGGDWSANRLVPDILRAAEAKRPLQLRYPHAVRPWQYVLEPLNGYMRLAELLFSEPDMYSRAWNFAPRSEDVATVQTVAEGLISKLGQPVSIDFDADTPKQHEAALLTLDCALALAQLGWTQRWDLDEALSHIADFWLRSQSVSDLRALCLQQIDQYEQN